MSDNRWQDYVVGDRMAVDREFSDRVTASEFSSQEWGLIMTATEFRIEHADDPDEAEIVPDTSKVEAIAGELDDIKAQMSAAGPGGPRGGREPGSSKGIVGSVKDALGLGGGDSGGRDPEEVRSRADALTREYAGLLQERLENEGRWEEIRALAAGETPAGAEESAESAGASPSESGADDADDGHGADPGDETDG